MILYHKALSTGQGIVADEETGRTVAVVYDSKDGDLLAAAPDLLEALEGLADCAGLSALPGYKKELDGAVLTARQAIAKAKGGAQ
jgi:hypothetical protein